MAFSCKGRGLCPSCGAKRAALFSELLQNKILADVPHAQWVFSTPKMLRPYFLFHPELLGELARLAYQTVREMMSVVVEEPNARPGMIAVIQTFGSSLRWNPHIHSITSRGLFTIDGVFLPIPYVDTHRAELLFRHKVLRLLRDEDLITQERIDLLLSWKNSGFGVHNHTTVYPQDTEGLHKLACYLMRAPVNLSRLRYHPESELILYESKSGHDANNHEFMDPLEFLARVLIHVPEPNKHLVRFYGAYANRLRSEKFTRETEQEQEHDEDIPPPRRTLSKRWAELVYRIYEVDPLTCRRCGEKMKLLAFIIDPAVIRLILDHLEQNTRPRAPP